MSQVVKLNTKKVVLKAQPDKNYLLMDGSGKSPSKIKMLKKGEDLEIYEEGKEEASLVIENYYAQNMNNSIVGLDASSGEEIAYMSQTDGWSSLELSDDTLGFFETPLGWGVGILGVGAAAIAVKNNNSSDDDDSGNNSHRSNNTTTNNTSSNNSIKDTIVKGEITAGPISYENGLTVMLYAADGVTLLGKAKVDPDGKYSINIGNYSGAVIARVIDSGDGVDFYDEATLMQKDLNATFLAVSIVDGNTIININPLTTLMAYKAGVVLNQDSIEVTTPLSQSNIDSANNQISSAFGLENTDIVSAPIMTTINKEGTSTIESSNDYGKILASLSGLDEENYGDMQVTLNEMNDYIVSGSLTFAGQGALLSGANNSGVSSIVVSLISPNAASEALNVTSTTEISTLSPAVIANLSSTQISSLTQTQINSLSSDQISALTSSQIVLLSPTKTVTINSISDDMGVSNSDFMTNDNNGLTINATLSAPLVQTELLMYSTDGLDWISIPTNGTSVSYMDSSLTSSSVVQMRVVNILDFSGEVASKSIFIDTTPPTGVATITSYDFVDDHNLMVYGTNTPLESGDSVKITYSTGYPYNWGSVTQLTPTTWSLHIQADSATTLYSQYNFQTKIVDSADNSGQIATMNVERIFTFPQEMDTTPPIAGILTRTSINDEDAIYYADKETSVSDFANTFNLTLSGNESGSTVIYQVSIDGGATWTATTANQSSVSDGNYKFKAVVIDNAGNSATTPVIDVKVDTTPPTGVATITSYDFVDNNNLMVYGTNTPLESGDSVKITYSTGYPYNWGSVTQLTPTTWSLHIQADSATTLYSQYNFQTKIVDSADNSGQIATMNVEHIVSITPLMLGINEDAVYTTSWTNSNVTSSDETIVNGNTYITVAGGQSIYEENPITIAQPVI